MRLDNTTPWARAALLPEDRAEIAQAEPPTGRCSLAKSRSGLYFAAITHVVPMQVQQGYGRSPIEAFRDALGKVTA